MSFCVRMHTNAVQIYLGGGEGETLTYFVEPILDANFH